MPAVKRTAQAEEDLIEIWIYIPQDNPMAADRVLDDIEEKCDALANNPLMGRLRAEIAPELRYFAVGKYLILYRTVQDGIEVVRVIHGACDWLHLF
jgi:toxin ParE1/3/4